MFLNSFHIVFSLFSQFQTSYYHIIERQMLCKLAGWPHFQSYLTQVPVCGNTSVHVFSRRGQKWDAYANVFSPSSSQHLLICGSGIPRARKTGMFLMDWSSMSSPNEAISSLAVYASHGKDFYSWAVHCSEKEISSADSIQMLKVKFCSP